MAVKGMFRMYLLIIHGSLILNNKLTIEKNISDTPIQRMNLVVLFYGFHHI